MMNMTALLTKLHIHLGNMYVLLFLSIYAYDSFIQEAVSFCFETLVLIYQAFTLFELLVFSVNINVEIKCKIGATPSF